RQRLGQRPRHSPGRSLQAGGATWGWDQLARVVREQDLDGLSGDHLHLGHDGEEAAPVGDPLLVEEGLAFAELAGDRLAARGPVTPLPVGPVKLRWVGMAAAVGLAAGGVVADHAAGADEAG